MKYSAMTLDQLLVERRKTTQERNSIWPDYSPMLLDQLNMIDIAIVLRKSDGIQ